MSNTIEDTDKTVTTSDFEAIFQSQKAAYANSRYPEYQDRQYKLKTLKDICTNML